MLSRGVSFNVLDTHHAPAAASINLKVGRSCCHGCWSIRLPRLSHHRLYTTSANRPAVSPLEGHVSRVFCFDIESVVSGLETVITECAWTTAKQLWPDSIVGQPSLYIRHMTQVLPAVEHTYEACMLIRLLADEGIIGMPLPVE